MKRWLIGLLAVIVLATTSYAADEENGFFLKASSMYRTEYIPAYGERLGSDVWQNDLKLSHTSGFYGTVSYYDGINGAREPDWREEFDVGLGYSKEVYGLIFDASITYWDRWRVLRNQNNDVLYPEFRVAKNFPLTETQALKPYAGIAFPIVVQGPDNGTYAYLGLKHAIVFNKWLELETNGTLFRDDGAMGLDHGLLADFGPTVIVKATKNVYWLTDLRLIAILSGMDDSNRGNDCVLGTGLGLNF